MSRRSKVLITAALVTVLMLTVLCGLVMRSGQSTAGDTKRGLPEPAADTEETVPSSRPESSASPSALNSLPEMTQAETVPDGTQPDSTAPDGTQLPGIPLMSGPEPEESPEESGQTAAQPGIPHAKTGGQAGRPESSREEKTTVRVTEPEVQPESPQEKKTAADTLPAAPGETDRTAETAPPKQQTAESLPPESTEEESTEKESSGPPPPVYLDRDIEEIMEEMNAYAAGIGFEIGPEAELGSFYADCAIVAGREEAGMRTVKDTLDWMYRNGYPDGSIRRVRVIKSAHRFYEESGREVWYLRIIYGN